MSVLLVLIFFVAAAATVVCLVRAAVAALRHSDNPWGKRAAVAAVVAVVLLVVIGTTNAPTGQPEELAAPAETPAPAPSPTPEPAPTPTPSPTPVLMTAPPRPEPVEITEDLAPTPEVEAAPSWSDVRHAVVGDFTTMGLEMSSHMDGDILYVNVWQDGAAADASLAAAGNEELQSLWAEVVDVLRSRCETGYQAICDAGYPDNHLCVQLLNDLNHDNVLLTVLDGVVVYDVTA